MQSLHTCIMCNPPMTKDWFDPKFGTICHAFTHCKPIMYVASCMLCQYTYNAYILCGSDAKPQANLGTFLRWKRKKWKCVLITIKIMIAIFSNNITAAGVPHFVQSYKINFKVVQWFPFLQMLHNIWKNNSQTIIDWLTRVAPSISRWQE